MKTLVTVLFCCFFIIVHAQQDLKIFTENKDKGYVLYVTNNEFCPITISLDLSLSNLVFSEGQQKIFVIPKKVERFKIGVLNVITPNEKYKYSYKYSSDFGDINIKQYDTAYDYALPYLKGKSFYIFQGYNGTFSHQDENALDFTMPEGTEILAAREGIIIKVVQNNTESCTQRECAKYNNYITVYHPDGTFADYAHIKYNGAKVKAGDRINKGDVIAYSGNTGWTNGPHLHFVCYIPGLEKRHTITTKFMINNGTRCVFLKEKETYLKDY